MDTQFNLLKWDRFRILPDGKEYEMGAPYFKGCIIFAVGEASTRVLDDAISVDELDAFAEEISPIRIFT